MEKQKLFKTTVSDLKLFVFQYQTSAIRPDTIFTLSYDLETAGKQASDLISKNIKPEEKERGNVNIIGNMPVHELLNQVERFEEKKEKEKKELLTKSSFLCNIKLASELYIKNPKDKKALDRIISAVDDYK